MNQQTENQTEKQTEVVVVAQSPTPEMARLAGEGVRAEGLPEEAKLLEAMRFEAVAVRVGRHISDFGHLPGVSCGSGASGRCAVVQLGEDALAVVQDLGVVTFFNASVEQRRTFLDRLVAHVEQAGVAQGSQEQASVRVASGSLDRVEGEEVVLNQATESRLVVLAEVLAKSVILHDYENRLQASFDRVGPLVAQLQEKGVPSSRRRRLMRHMGEMLAFEADLVGGGRMDDKPEVLWHRPELEKLHDNLVEEYDITDRFAAVGHKVEVISRSNNTLIDLIHTRDSHRVEWYILWVIVFEVLFLMFVEWHDMVERCHELFAWMG